MLSSASLGLATTVFICVESRESTQLSCTQPQQAYLSTQSTRTCFSTAIKLHRTVQVQAVSKASKKQSWRSFKEAQSFMHTLGLESAAEWKDWCRRGERPEDIPADPDRVYKDEGWESYPDWLGYSRFKFLPFEEARSFVHTLGFENQDEWKDWCRRGERPPGIPSNPHDVYKNEGWVSFADWLGYLHRSEFLPFEEAREYMRGLGLKSCEEWKKWSSSGERPKNIPSHPSRTYADEGWLSFPDWLGYGIGKQPQSRRQKEFLSFEEARSFVHTLGLGSAAEWVDWCRRGERPEDIPSNAHEIYKDEGWVSWPDWLGFLHRRKFLPFEEARSFMHTQGLGSQAEWQDWKRRGERPPDIPSTPQRTYKDEGWESYPDWLGYSHRSEFLPFEEAREYARGLGLTSTEKWHEWSSSGERPENIPSNPSRTYADEGWLAWPDWLGYGIGKPKNNS